MNIRRELFIAQTGLFILLSVICRASGPETMARWEQQPSELRVFSDRKAGVLAAWITTDSSGPSAGQAGSWVGAQLINFNGKNQWGHSGVRLTPAALSYKELRAASDHNGGAVLVWKEESAAQVRYWLQRVDTRGGVRWPVPGVLVASPTVSSSAMALDVDEKGRTYLAWEELEGDHSVLRCQIIDDQGHPKWPAGGRIVALAHVSLTPPAIAADLEGGFLVVWRSSDPASALFTGQYVDSNNRVLWDVAGSVVSTQQASQPVIQSAVYTTDHELLVVWKDTNQVGNTWTAQSMNAHGKRRWGDEGMSLNYQKGEQENDSISVDRMGKMTLAWEEASASPRKIFLQQWDWKGLALWNISGAAVVEAREGEQRDPYVVAEDGDAHVLWLDNTDHPWELYAQRMKGNGEPAWHSGAVVTPVGTSPGRPLGSSDFSGGVVALWLEQTPAQDWLLQAFRINASGSPAW